MYRACGHVGHGFYDALHSDGGACWAAAFVSRSVSRAVASIVQVTGFEATMDKVVDEKETVIKTLRVSSCLRSFLRVHVSLLLLRLSPTNHVTPHTTADH